MPYHIGEICASCYTCTENLECTPNGQNYAVLSALALGSTLSREEKVSGIFCIVSHLRFWLSGEQAEVASLSRPFLSVAGVQLSA